MKQLWTRSEPGSTVAGQQSPYAGKPDVVSGQAAPIARGESSNESVSQKGAGGI